MGIDFGVKNDSFYQLIEQALSHNYYYLLFMVT